MGRFELLAQVLAFLVLLAVLGGCGREQPTPAPTPRLTPSAAVIPTPSLTPTPTHTQTPTSDPTLTSNMAMPTVALPSAPTPIHLESGSVALYFQASLGSDTSYHTVEGQTLVMKGSGGAVFRYLPDQDNLTSVESYVSPSYSRNVLHPYTVDGRLFLVQVWPDSRSADFDEFDPTGVGRLAQNAARVDSNSDYESWSEYAVVGNRLYYQTKRRSDPFGLGGYSGGHLMVKDLASSARARILLWHDDPDNHGALHSAGGNLYRVDTTKEMDFISVNRIDLTTGNIAQVVTRLSFGNPDDYKNWNFAVDEDAFYIAIQEKGAAVVHLLRLPWADAEKGDPSLVLSQTLADERDSLVGLDADEGFVVLAMYTSGKGSFILYDQAIGNATTFEPGRGPAGYVQILELR